MAGLMTDVPPDGGGAGAGGGQPLPPPPGGMGQGSEANLAQLADGPTRGGQLFPNGLDIENLLSDGDPSPQEKMETNDASAVGKYVAYDDNIQQTIKKSVKANPEDAVNSVISASTQLVNVFNEMAASNGGISSLMWLTGIDAIIDATILTAKESGGVFDNDAMPAIWAEVMGSVRNGMIERGWVSEQELSQLINIMVGRDKGQMDPAEREMADSMEMGATPDEMGYGQPPAPDQMQGGGAGGLGSMTGEDPAKRGAV